MVKYGVLAIFFVASVFALAGFAEEGSFPQEPIQASIPDIRTIPRLKAGLAPETIAWATPDQLHPTQPQTGSRDVFRKAERFLKLLVKDKNVFSEELYKFAYKKSVAPVFIAQVPPNDSRSGQMSELGYITDRTHGSFAQSIMIEKTYGKEALRNPLYDKEGRPLNFILVRVVEDKSQLSSADFAEYMVKNENCYLEKVERGKGGKTIETNISFVDLPEFVYQTTNNPYRGLVSALQSAKKIGRLAANFSQFFLAKALYQNEVVEWDDIDLMASKKSFEKSIDTSAKFFLSKKGRGLFNVDERKSVGLLCKDILSEPAEPD